MRTLHENIRKLRLDPERHVPAHGRIGTHAEFVELVTGNWTVDGNPTSINDTSETQQ